MATGGHHLQGFLYTGDAGQTLGAAGAGQQAEIDLRQAQSRGGNRDAIVGAESHFQAAAQGGAVDSGDHRLGRVFHHRLYIEQ